MGSGKTEFSSRVWRDAAVARKKSAEVAASTTTDGADRRILFFVRSKLDAGRFPEYPKDALAYRGGFERCGERIAFVGDSFELESVLAANPDAGTWILDEAAFYDERIAYLVRDESERRGLVFVCPTLILNFRREIFNQTARLLLENATDVFPLTAYCEHPDCMRNSLYTYRYYRVDGVECPALYFDPLIIIGGDSTKDDGREPNYCTRCGAHHYLPGKEYTFFTLKPMGERASRGDTRDLVAELERLAGDPHNSRLKASLAKRHVEVAEPEPVFMRSLGVPCLAERALVYLYAELNLLDSRLVSSIARDLGLDRAYLAKSLSDNRRPLAL
jgi:thymidine kinase